jgi:hypothetical protein
LVFGGFGCANKSVDAAVCVETDGHWQDDSDRAEKQRVRPEVGFPCAKVKLIHVTILAPADVVGKVNGESDDPDAKDPQQSFLGRKQSVVEIIVANEEKPGKTQSSPLNQPKTALTLDCEVTLQRNINEMFS